MHIAEVTGNRASRWYLHAGDLRDIAGTQGRVHPSIRQRGRGCAAVAG